MYAIFAKELRSLFLSPLAWSLLLAMQLLLAWLFLVQLEQFLQIQPKLAGMENAPGVGQLVIAPLLDSSAVILLLLIPLLSMGMFSREASNGTLNLLFSSPVSTSAIVLGKYLALLALLTIMLLMIALMPISLLLGTAPDMGTLAAALLALALAMASYAALSLWISSLTQQPAVAAVLSCTLLFLLWIINLTGSGEISPLMEQLSLSSHFQRMLSGLVTSADITYFLLLTSVSLLLCIHRIERLRVDG